MGTFPIQYSNSAPPAASPQPRAGLHTNDGTSELWQTVAQGGQQMTALGMGIANHIQDAANAIQLSTLKRKSDELLFAGYQEASQAADDQTALKVWTAAHEKAAALGSGQNRLVADAYQIHLNNTLGQWNENLAVKRLAIKKENAFDAATINQKTAMETGDLKSATDAINQKIALFPNKRAEFEQEIKELHVNSELAQIQILAATFPEIAKKKLDAVRIWTPQQAERKDNLAAHINAQINRSRELNKAEIDKQQLDLYKEAYIDKTPLTWERVASTSLSADEKISFWEHYKKVQADKVKAGVSALEESDPQVKARLLYVIDMKPTSITTKDIYDLVGKGIGTNDVTQFVDRHKQVMAGKQSPQEKKYLSALSGLYGNGKNEKEVFRYMEMREKLELYLKSKPTEEQARSFFGGLIKEDTSWGYTSSNELPGWDDRPISTIVETKQGPIEYKIRFGDIINVDGKTMQAIGRENGKVKWQITK